LKEEKKSKSGEIFNDFPDRIADVLILFGAGYSLTGYNEWASTLGWLACIAALFTAYTRMLGGACGTKQYFEGPLAKQHRMFVITVCALLGAIEYYFYHNRSIMLCGIIIIIVGSFITTARRVGLIVNALESMP